MKSIIDFFDKSLSYYNLLFLLFEL